MSRSRSETAVVEVEFRVDDPSYPFVDASWTANCRLGLEVIVPHSDGGFVECFTVEGAPPNSSIGSNGSIRRRPSPTAVIGGDRRRSVRATTSRSRSSRRSPTGSGRCF